MSDKPKDDPPQMMPPFRPRPKEAESFPFAPDGSEELGGFRVGDRVEHLATPGLGHVQGFPKRLPRNLGPGMLEVHWDDHSTSWARIDLLRKVDSEGSDV